MVCGILSQIWPVFSSAIVCKVTLSRDKCNMVTERQLVILDELVSFLTTFVGETLEEAMFMLILCFVLDGMISWDHQSLSHLMIRGLDEGSVPS